MIKKIFFSLIAIFFFSPLSFARSNLDLPPLTSPVMDFAEIIDEESASQMNKYIRSLYSQTGVQIVILTIHSLGNMSIEEFSMAVAEEWKIGQKGKDNGILLTVAYEDHELRIEVGYGLEGTLTDALSSQIIRNYITPEFKAGNYSQGIINGLLKIAEVSTNGAKIESDLEIEEIEIEEESDEWSLGDTISLVWTIFIFSLAIPSALGFGPFACYFFAALLSGKPFHRRWPKSSGHSHHDDFGGGFGGGFGGSSGSDSGFSGGGGSFGGGGSSGKW